VTAISGQLKKTILANPASELADRHPHASEQEVTTLQGLAQQYADQAKQHREIQKQTQKLSRLIGSAKKKGENTDELIAAMQQHSKQRKALAAATAAIENRILEYFEPANKDSNATGAAAVNDGRSYPATDITIADITVSLDNGSGDDWNRYVESNPAASIYHRAEWKALIKTTFGHEGHYFAARDRGGNIVGILPLVRLSSRLFGDFMVSMPYFNYGGAIADHPEIEQRLMEAAAEHAGELGVSHIEYRDDTPREGLPARTEKVNMILDLPDNHEDLWQAFTPKLRAQIRRPQRENVQVLLGGKQHLQAFYSVFARNMRDLGTPVYAKSLFSNILDSFPDDSRIMVIMLAGRPVAAAFLIGHRDTLEIPWASTIRDVNHLSINMLLYWEVLKHAIDMKFRQFDFGRSSKGAGTHRFKQQWGAQPRQLYWHYWQRDGGELPTLNPDNPRYKLAITIWRRLPLVITKGLGPLIVRNLP